MGLGVVDCRFVAIEGCEMWVDCLRRKFYACLSWDI